MSYQYVDQLPEDERDKFVDGEVLGDDSPCHQFPMYPLDAPGMSPPGVGVVKNAELRWGEHIYPRSLVKKTGELKVKVTDGEDIRRHPAVRDLYWQMLYPSPDLRIEVTASKVEYQVQVVPGHLWEPNLGDREVLGPTYHDTGDNPRVMVVGKMPGKPEVTFHRSLIGNLKDFLEEVIVGDCEYPQELLDDWYVTTAIKWLNPSQSGGSSGVKGWIKDCLPILEQEIKIVQPDFILCMGSEATQAVLKGGKITELQGVVSDYEYCTHLEGDEPEIRNAKVVCVPNPGAILHNPDLEDQFLSDIRRFLNLTQGIEAREDDIEVVSIRHIDHLRQEVDSVLRQPGLRVIAVDGEWHGERWNKGSYLRTIQFCWDGSRGLCIEFREPGGEWCFEGTQDEIAIELQRMLYAERVQICGSFFNADEPWLESIGVPLSDFYTVPLDFEDMNQGEYEGGFDVALAAHAYDETANYKLELMGVRFCGARRWDVDLNRWLEGYCRRNKLKKSELGGYGEVPCDILLPYGARDVIYTWRLREKFCSLLSRDPKGNDCWRAFHTSMLAFPAFGEISKEGLYADVETAAILADSYQTALQEREQEFRDKIEWPDFKPRSLFHVRELLFGENLNRKVPGGGVRLRPEGALSLYLDPVLSAGKKSQNWAKLVEKGRDKFMNPSTNDTVLGLLSEQSELAKEFADLRYVDQVIKTFLAPPIANEDEDDEDEDSLEYTWSKGNLRFIQSDSKVHPFMVQTKETGRAAAARPNIMAISKSREADYERILGDHYKMPIRCIFVANNPRGETEPYVFVESDFSTAELLTVGVQARDLTMIEHCLDPSYDIHSQVAVQAFSLPCEPTKKGVEGYRKGLRNAAKTVVFGSNYCQGPEGLATNINKKGELKVTVEEARALQDALYHIYYRIPEYQRDCMARVTNERWMRNCKGRLRRFGVARDDFVQAGMERQAANFAIQSTVADVMSEVMSHFYWHESKERLRYTIVAQVHDALVFRLPVSSLEEFTTTVLPSCMVDRVHFKSCDLDGNVHSGWEDKEFRFSIEYEVMERWGRKLSEEDCDRLGIDSKYSDDQAYNYPIAVAI